jgi:MFS-type transporter involved in bile tolerance (Atg22 family)
LVCETLQFTTANSQELKLTTKLTEGLPTVLFSPVVFFLLPDSPGQAKFLSENEQTLAVERLQTRDHTAKNKVQWTQFLAGVLDYRNVVHALIHFMCNYSFAGLSNFLPTIVKGMGYSSIDAQGLTAPVYFASFLLCIAAASISDRYGKRGFIVAGFATMGCIGYLLLVTIEDGSKTGARYCGVWLAVSGIFPALAINVSSKLRCLPAQQFMEFADRSSPLDHLAS